MAIFGPTSVKEGRIDRTEIANIVKSAPQLLDTLEDVCHPYVNNEILRHFRLASQHGGYALFVVEIPLLFESRYPMWQWFQKTVAVISDREQAIERYVHAGGTMEQFLFRESRQMAPEEKRAKANFTIFNNGSIQELELQARKLFEQLTT